MPKKPLAFVKLPSDFHQLGDEERNSWVQQLADDLLQAHHTESNDGEPGDNSSECP